MRVTAGLILTYFLTPALPAAETVVAIRDATVETLGSSGRIDRATIVIRDGRIEAVGKNLPVPDGAKLVDASGGTEIPGIIDPIFEVPVAAASAEGGSPRTIVIGGRTITLPAAPTGRGGYTRVADNFYPYDAAFRPLARVGLTRLNLVAGGSGQAAVARLSPDDPERMLVSPNGAAFATVTNSSDSIDQVRGRLELVAARSRATGGTSPAGPGPTGRGGAAPAGTQMWQDVHDGKTPLVVTAANSAAIVHLMRSLEPYKNVRLVLFGAGDALYEARSSLAGRNVTAVLRPGIDLMPNSRERLNAPRALHEAGVAIAFSLSARPPAVGAGAGIGAGAGDTEAATTQIDSECPLFPVAMVVKGGLPRLIALEALTKRPAQIVGHEKSLGSIEPGKTADLLLFTGDPFDPTSRLRMTMVDGRTVHAN